jgi:hypothetical protein
METGFKAHEKKNIVYCVTADISESSKRSSLAFDFVDTYSRNFLR